MGNMIKRRNGQYIYHPISLFTSKKSVSGTASLADELPVIANTNKTTKSCPLEDKFQRSLSFFNFFLQLNVDCIFPENIQNNCKAYNSLHGHNLPRDHN